MGNYINLFEKNEQEQKIILSPTKSDFITGYADLTGRNLKKSLAINDFVKRMNFFLF